MQHFQPVFVLEIFQLIHFHTGEPILITPEARYVPLLCQRPNHLESGIRMRPNKKNDMPPSSMTVSYDYNTLQVWAK